MLEGFCFGSLLGNDQFPFGKDHRGMDFRGGYVENLHFLCVKYRDVRGVAAGDTFAGGDGIIGEEDEEGGPDEQCNVEHHSVYPLDYLSVLFQRLSK